MEKESYKIVIGSPVEYEELVAYIVINDDYVALLNIDKGIDNLKIEFFEEPRLKSVNYDLFLEALEKARSKLVGK